MHNHKHKLTEKDLELNPDLRDQGHEVGDEVESADLAYREIPAGEQVGKEAEDTVNPPSGEAHQPTVFENNKINVVGEDGETVRTFSGEADGQNWKKLAEMYAQENGLALGQYHSSAPHVTDVKEEGERVVQRSDRFAKQTNRKSNEAKRPPSKKGYKSATGGRRLGKRVVRARGTGKAAGVRKQV